MYNFYQWYRDLKSTFRDGMRIITDPMLSIGMAGISVSDTIRVSEDISRAVTQLSFDTSTVSEDISIKANIFLFDELGNSDYYTTSPMYVSREDTISIQESIVVTWYLTCIEYIKVSESAVPGFGISGFDIATLSDYSDFTWIMTGDDVISTLDSCIIAVEYSGTSQYRDGSVTVIDGSDIVSGFNTEFSNYISTDSLFQISVESAWYKVRNVIDNSTIQLADAYHGSGASNASYVIHQLFTEHRKIPELSRYDEQWYEIYNRAIRTIDKDIYDLLECMYYHPDFIETGDNVSIIDTYTIVENLKSSGNSETATISEDVKAYRNFYITETISVKESRSISIVTV